MGGGDIFPELFFLSETDRYFIKYKLITDYGFKLYELASLCDVDLVELLENQKTVTIDKER
ncbi:hypothetical protein CJP46_02655 [Paenibacillus sp. XY044]|nr:hypothetical protein CJP46_02655 [Paenibacillus sp. XY044]